MDKHPFDKRVKAEHPRSGVPPAGDMTGLAEKFNKNIRPLLDAVDMLRNLKVTDEGIPLPSIVVVGDQSSGKSSVLESLATISLPRGQGIATRAPLDTQLSITEDEIESRVNEATNVLAGTGKGVVTDAAISLHIRRPNAPDLTMIDLPGITRVPVHGQPADIYEQISAMIRKYLKPKETVILNVLSAAVDFATCESIKMSQEEDKNGERTLAVVTKVDRAPDDVYEKVMADDVNIGLGYICVRNRIGDGSHEEAREQERELFSKHSSLSKLDKSSVGIPSLAERLTQIQANIIRSSLPGIQQKIDKALMERRRELEALPQGALCGVDPTVMFLNIVDQIKTTMEDILMNGNYDIVADENEMHYPARLDEMFRKFSDELHDSHEFARNFVFNIIEKSASMFPNLHGTYKKEADNVLAVSLRKCMKYVCRVLQKERSNVFTMNDYYMANVEKIRDHLTQYRSGSSAVTRLQVEGFKNLLNLSEPCCQSNEYKSAFDMKVNLAAYCKVVHKRMADEIPLELRFSLENAVLRGIRSAMLKAKAGQDLSTLMEENASTLQKRLTLRKRVDTLTECKGVLLQLL
ncbi:unnamed protein product [Calypogeia fissa]